MEQKRDILEVDVLFVGAGPANLAGALHLSNLIKKQGLGEISIAILEKGKEVGSHIISGCILDTSTLEELIPDYQGENPPLGQKVEKDSLFFFTEKGKIEIPFIPKLLNNHGCYIISLRKFVQWLAKSVEARGVDIFCEFPGSELLFKNDRTIGIRTGDKGLDKSGNQKNNYEPGADILASITVLGEGSRGSLTKAFLNKFSDTTQINPQVYSVGIKEIWKVPSSNRLSGKVIHTFGYPLDNSTYGGGFLYGMEDNLLAIGLVVGLNYQNPMLDPHHEFQRFKKHPFISNLLAGGEIISYGAKTLPEGGYYSIPKIYGNGLLIAGDSAGFLDSRRLKGVHLAIKSGILAAETIFHALKEKDYSENTLKRYEEKVRESVIEKELHMSRNFHQGFQKGFFQGLLKGAFQLLTKGRWGKPIKIEEGHKRMKKLKDYYGDNLSKYKSHIIKFDNKLTFDKETDVFYSGTNHDEDQPCHLKISNPDVCKNECRIEFGNPCQYFCPSNVYEIVENEESGEKELKLNPANCVHCKTCDIMDPYEIIDWVPPEGGGGPAYKFQ
ncbi:MAG TPA: electron transfer flavoprotein-ubiquinone oxidoreductase [Nitrospinota bacterium]|nr:electron transfer flavoprotein-ubiquinone oxidoreductase [Nitrospinota bacterium]